MIQQNGEAMGQLAGAQKRERKAGINTSIERLEGKQRKGAWEWEGWRRKGELATGATVGKRKGPTRAHQFRRIVQLSPS